MKRAARIIGLILAIALIGYFLWFTVHSIDLAVIDSLLTPGVILALVAAALAYALIIPPSGWAWARLLSAQGEQWPATWLAAVLAVTQIAKYIPGNVAQHAGRAGLALQKGMKARALLVSVLQETVFAASASLLVGVAMLAASGLGWSQIPPSARPILTGAVIATLLAILTLATIRLPASTLAHSPHGIARLIGHLGGLPGARIGLPALAIYACNYLLIGLGLWGVAYAAAMPPTLGFQAITAAFALSWLLGFMAPGAPAGLGVREGILVVLLQGTADDGHLLAFVLLARIVTMLGDTISFVWGTVWFTLNRGTHQ